jgi:hypothetical protein
MHANGSLGRSGGLSRGGCPACAADPHQWTFSFSSTRNTGWSRSFVAVAPLVILIVGFNLWVELNNPWPIYRAEIFSLDLAGRASALSLTNLIWPLCLQLANNAITTKWRLLFLSLLAPLVAESPFRGVILIVGIFGFVAPVVEQAIKQIRSRGFGARQAAIYGSIILLGLTAITAELAVETQKRSTDLKMAGGIVSQLTGKLGQRIAIPLYQAHLVLAHDIDPHVPSLSDEVLTKLRLAVGPASTAISIG